MNVSSKGDALKDWRKSNLSAPSKAKVLEQPGRLKDVSNFTSVVGSTMYPSLPTKTIQTNYTH